MDFFKKIINKYAPYMLGIILLGGLIAWFVKDYYGVEEVGHFFEKNEYSAIYYVNLYKTRDDMMSERVRGWIDVASNKTIYLAAIYFSKNRSVLLGSCSLTLGEKEYCIDDEDNNWYIELDKKARECTAKKIATVEKNSYRMDVNCED